MRSLLLNKISTLTLCIRETHKRVLLQTVKTKMKCSIMLHFIRVYTVCKGQKDLQTKEYNILKKYIYNRTPLDMYNGLSQSNCIKPEGRTIQRFKKDKCYLELGHFLNI